MSTGSAWRCIFPRYAGSESEEHAGKVNSGGAYWKGISMQAKLQMAELAPATHMDYKLCQAGDYRRPLFATTCKL